MKVLISKLNKELSVLNNTRVNDFGKFHEQVDELLAPHLPEELKYRIWSIYFNYATSESIESAEIFKLNIDFINDKRIKNCNRKGKLIRCWISQTVKGKTLPEIMVNIKMGQREKAIVYLKREIIELEGQLADAKKSLKEAKNSK